MNIDLTIINSKKSFTEEVSCKRFIDYNKEESRFYNNFYFDEYKLVIKLPFIEKADKKPDIKIESFSIENEVYLTSY